MKHWEWVWSAQEPLAMRAALMHLSKPDVQDRVRLAAVCDPVPGRAEAAAEKYGVAAHYLTYEELLADPHVDMVTICTPIGLHFAQGMQAIEAGKHIHFNKTMTDHHRRGGPDHRRRSKEGREDRGLAGDDPISPQPARTAA